MKKVFSIALTLLFALALLAGCGSGNTGSTGGTSAENTTTQDEPSSTGDAPEAGDFDLSEEITVVSREDGSGTRGAFVELFGIEQQNEDGDKVDMTTQGANITNSTSVMMTTVAGDEAAIGYISLGSLNDTVKALSIDGVEPTVENIISGDYTVSRPFNIATGDSLSADAQDFIDFILSAEGQQVVEDNGYIAVDGADSYSGGSASGTVVVAGSSSVSPVMEKLKEAYELLNPDVNVEIQTSDSSTGMSNAIEGICDIGMASRELKDSELDAGLTPTVIAMDGIAVIVNNANPFNDLSTEAVRDIFTGEIYTWEEI